MRIAIVGGGVGGLATALALQGPGRDITVYEATTFDDPGSGVQLSPNAVRALRTLGVEEALRPKTMAPDAIELRRGADEGLLIRSPLGAALERRAGAPYLHVRRADLHAALAAAVQDRGAARIVLGARAASISTETGRPRVRFSDGSEVDADLLVGADGLGSTVRKALLGEERARHTGRIAWRGTVPLRVLPASLFPPVVAVRLGAGRHFVSYRVAGDAVNFVGVVADTASSDESWSQDGDPAELAAAFAGWSPAVQALIDACERPRRWALLDRDPAPVWSGGGAVLLGDAAHPIPPHLAQGAAMALEDAVVLGRALAAGADLASGLFRYEAARRRRTTRVLQASRRQGRLLELGGLPGLLAHAGLQLAGRVAQGAPVRSLDWLYRYDAATTEL